MKTKTIRLILAILIFGVMSIHAFADMPSDWAIDEVNRAVSAGLVSENLQCNYQNNITRDEFAECAVRLCAAYFGEDISVVVTNHAEFEEPDFSDLDKDSREYSINAYRLGIVKGKSEKVFAPNSHITRQEAAVMLYRTQVLCMQNEDFAVNTTNFTDDNKIADWAKNAVYTMSASGIMRGMPDNSFSPLGYLTRQQCYITMVRMLDSIKSDSASADKKTEQFSELFSGKHNTITTNYFVYDAYENGNAIVKEYIGPDGIMVMQPEIDGYKVCGIASGAFDGKEDVQLCVPDSVVYLENDSIPTSFKAVYYESEDSLIKKYLETSGINSELWDWSKIACIKWARRDDKIERPDPVHGTYYNNDISFDAVTMIYCERSPEKDFDYTIQNGEVTVNDYTGEGMYVSIPEYIEGKPVRTLGFESFSNLNAEHLEIPKTVRKIDHYSCGIKSDINTVHVLNGEDCILGESVFCGSLNHVRFHNNIKGDFKNEGEKPDDYKKLPPVSITMAIVPYNFYKINGFNLSIFVYNAE